MRAKPYVGVTGCVTKPEVMNVLDKFSDAGYCGASHEPMTGFLVSYKTLNGRHTSNRRYPGICRLPDLVKASYAFNMVHYNSRELNTLAEQVINIFNGIYPKCHALQLNIPWPDPRQLELIKNEFTDMEIVFQASRKVTAGKSAALIADCVAVYGDLVDYVLIDPSGGQGKPFDLERSLSIYSELRSRTPELTIGFAGGFTGDNVAERLELIIDRLGESSFCIDAEGGLRNKVTDAYGDDLLDIEKVGAYVHGSSRILR